jgi:hypothetical protein
LEANDNMLRQPRRRKPEIEHRRWFLCHRGADRSVIAEIVVTLEANRQTVTVQEHDGLSMPLAAFRASINREIDNGHRYFIVLLNEHLTGPIYRQTFSPIRKRVGNEVAFYTMRVEDCDTDGVDWPSVDLALVEDPDARRREIVSICPTDSARCCGLRAA